MSKNSARNTLPNTKVYTRHCIHDYIYIFIYFIFIYLSQSTLKTTTRNLFNVLRPWPDRPITGHNMEINLLLQHGLTRIPIQLSQMLLCMHMFVCTCMYTCKARVWLTDTLNVRLTDPTLKKTKITTNYTISTNILDNVSFLWHTSRLFLDVAVQQYSWPSL